MSNIKIDSINTDNEHFNEVVLRVRVPKQATAWTSKDGKKSGASLIDMYRPEAVMTPSGKECGIQLKITAPREPSVRSLGTGVAYEF